MSKFIITDSDALVFMDRLLGSPRRFDAIITDPPFSNSRASRAEEGTPKHAMKVANAAHAALSPDGLAWTMRQIGQRATKLLKPAGSLLMFADLEMLFKLRAPMESSGLWFRNTAVWDKMCLGQGVGFRMNHEFIIHFSQTTPNIYDKGVPSVLSYPRVKRSQQRHENEKPIELLKRLVGMVSPTGGWVLDPFAGSFNTGFACHELGRNFVGCDINPTHVESARSLYNAIMAAPPVVPKTAV